MSTDFNSLIKLFLHSSGSSRLSTLSWDVVQAVLLSDAYKAVKTLPGSERTYELAIAQGEMIASLESHVDFYYPHVPELLLHKWISSVKNVMVTKLSTDVDDVRRCASTSFVREKYTADDDVQRNVAANLDSILSTRHEFSATSVEDIFLRYEIILSYLRSNLADKRARYESIDVRDLY